MSITRTAWTDDDGTGTTGTILNNAAKTTLYDELDARWSRVTTTATGAQNNLSVSEADLLICNNASDLTITGFVAPASPAKPGKRLYIVSTGAGNVLLTHQSASSTAANRLINFATSGNTPLAAGTGVAVYVYDDANSRWRLMAHEQGAWITPTFAAGNYTGGGGTWTVGSGDVNMQRYRLSGRTLQVSFDLTTTTVTAGTGGLLVGNGAWGSFTAVGTQWITASLFSDNGGAITLGYLTVGTGASATAIQVTKTAGGTFGAATDATKAWGEIAFEVS